MRTTAPTLLLLDRRLGVEPSQLRERIAVVAVCDNARLSFALGDDDLGEGIQRIADLLAR